jgi:acyl carrier protein
MNISEIVKQEVAQVCAVTPAEIRDEASLAEYGLDSMRSMELIVSLESRFNIQIHDDDLGDVRTVADVIRALQRTVKQ